MEEEILAPMYVYYIFGAIFSSIVLLALTGNGVAIFVFFKSNSLNITHNILVCSLCLCNLLEGIGGTLLVAISTFAGRWIFEDGGCYAHGALMTFLALTQITILSLISVVRVLTVNNSKLYKFFVRRRICYWISFCFIFGGLWALFPFFGWGSYHVEGLNTACAPYWKSRNITDIAYCACILIVFFLIPLCVICVSYYSVLRKLALSKKRSCRKGYMVERHVTITVSVIIGAFLMSWTPYAVMSLYNTVTKGAGVNPIVGCLPALFAKLSSIWNPIIYFVRNSRYREAFFEVFPAFSRHVVDDSTQTGDIFQQMLKLEPREPTVRENPPNVRSTYLQEHLSLDVCSVHHQHTEDGQICVHTVTPETVL